MLFRLCAHIYAFQIEKSPKETAIGLVRVKIHGKFVQMQFGYDPSVMLIHENCREIFTQNPNPDRLKCPLSDSFVTRVFHFECFTLNYFYFLAVHMEFMIKHRIV